jgi:microcystin-dependent protein
MASPFIGEIRMFGGNFEPQGWAFCNGQLLPISENQALFALIGTTYGGDGQTTFALPNLQGRFPIHQGSGSVIGQQSGSETVTLTANQIPAHTHAAQCSTQGAAASPNGAVWGTDPGGNIAPYSTSAANGTMNAGALSPAGGNQPHDNMQPFLVVSFIISLFGIFPSQN